jgi:predicted enzyme related to lactoylglutathione lyase
MVQNAVCWFEIYVQDMERAKRFYETVLQVKLEKLNSTVPELWAFPQSFANYGASGALAKLRGVASGGNSTLVYFSCVDCAEEAKRVMASGGRILKEKFSIGEYGFIVLAFDPENNMFGLHSTQ